MTFKEIVSKKLETPSVIIPEEILGESLFFATSPAVAFMAFKKKAFNAMAKDPILDPAKYIGKELKNNTAKGIIGFEKAKAKLGINSKGKNSTIYHFTKEQQSFLADLQNKYGSDLVKSIETFRENVLAPYAIIKKSVKENYTLNSKEVYGMTKEEFLKYRESGRKKIERRSGFQKGFRDSSTSLRDAKEGFKSAEEAYDKFMKGDSVDISNNDMEKVFKLMKIGSDDMLGYNKEELRDSVRKIKINREVIARKIAGKNGKPIDFETLMKDSEIIRSKGIGSVENKKKYESDGKKGSFSKALSLYLLRDEVRKDLRENLSKSEYKEFYEAVLKEMISAAKTKKDEIFDSMVKGRKNIELNSFEKKIWKPLPTSMVKYSSDIKDYFQKIKEEDFGSTKFFKVPEEVRKAEDAVNNETKKFEKKLLEMVTPEELAEMKRLRLINNLITVREMSSPETLFKTSSEIEKDDSNEKMSETEFTRKVKNLISMKFDTMKELEEAKAKVKKMEEEVDPKISKKYADLLNQFYRRKTLAASQTSGHKYDVEDELIDIHDVEEMFNKILEKDYKTLDDFKQEKMELNGFIEKFKKQDPNAEKELGEIDMLVKALNRKTEGLNVNLIGSKKNGDDTSQEKTS